MEHNGIQWQMQESENQFRNQFDRQNPSFHKGLTTPVPIGGAKVPESMSTMYPEGFDPNKAEEIIDYGQEYRQVEINRTIYLNLKKELAKLGPIVESFLRHEDHFKTKGDPLNEAHRNTYESNIAKQTATLTECQQALRAYEDSLLKMDAEGIEISKELIKVIAASSNKYSDKQSLTDFNFSSKKLSTRVFSAAQKLLQRLKDIKKAYAKGKPQKKEQMPAVQP